MADRVALPLLAATVCMTYVSLLRDHRDFLSYDDQANYVRNPLLQPDAPVGDSLRRCFTEPTLGVMEPAANIAKLAVSWASTITIETFARVSSTTAKMLGGDNNISSPPTPLSSSSSSPAPSAKVSVRPFLMAALLLHVANTIMSATLTAKLTRHSSSSSATSGDSLSIVYASAVALLLFGIHPLHTEVVAWASCFPYAVAAFFSLCSLHYHIDNKRVLAAVCLLLATLSKAASVSVFLVLLISARPTRRTRHDSDRPRGSVYITAALYAVSGVLGLGIAAWANENGGRRVGEAALNFRSRIVKATHGFWWYPGRALRPWLPLTIQYEIGDLSLMPVGDDANSSDSSAESRVISYSDNNDWNVANLAFVLLTLVIVGGAGLYLFLLRPKNSAARGYGGVGADVARMVLQYAVVLAPVSGIVSHGHVTLAADRYAYIPFCLVIVPGVTKIFSGVVQNIFGSASPSSSALPSHARQKLLCVRASAVIALVAVAAPLSELTSAQANHWSDDIRLWTHALRHAHPNAASRGEMALNLAAGLAKAGYRDNAITIFHKILQRSSIDEASTSQGYYPVFQSKGKAAHAHHAYGNALLEFEGGEGAAQNNVKAFRQFETAIQLDPMLSEPLASLAELYRLRGSEHIMDNKDLGGVLGRHEIEEGVGELEQALKYYGKARRTAEFGLTAAGIEQRNQVGSCTDPNTVLTSSSFWLAYGMCVVERRQFSKFKPRNAVEEGKTEGTDVVEAGRGVGEAEIFFKRAVELKPDSSEAHYQVAKTIKRRGGESARILYHYQQCIQLQPTHVNAIFGMANYLHSLGDSAGAIPHYRRAIAIEPEATDLRINLALSLRAVGQDSESLKEARAILELDSFHSKATKLVEMLTSKAAAKAEAASAEQP